MQRRMAPWLVLAGLAMCVFVVWLFAQMTRTPRTTAYALEIGGCVLAVLVTLSVVSFFSRPDR